MLGLRFAKTLPIALICASMTLPKPALSCTLAFWNNNSVAKVNARSMDLFRDDEPLFVVYPKNMTRTGGAGKNSAKWQSLYGSVVLTAFHSNVVSEGMNEKGLATELLYLDKTEYELRQMAKPGVSNLSWAQYLLDNAGSVNEALQKMEKIQIVSTEILGKHWPLHLTMQDASGDSAIIEFINGKMVVHHGYQYTVLTNEPSYHEQIANLKRYKLFGGSLPMPGDIDPLSRFVRASSYLKTLPSPENDIDALAGILSVIRTVMVPFGAQNTSQDTAEDTWPTRWITLKDLTHPTYYFSSTSAPNIIWLDFKKLNFNKGAPTLTVDPRDKTLSGEISDKLKSS